MMTTAPLQPNGTDVIDGITAQGVDAVLRACARAGVVVTADGPDLEVWTEDGSPIPVALIAALRDHKAALLAILAGKRPQRGHCWTCGERLPLEPHLLYAHCAGCAVAALARRRETEVSDGST